MDFADIVRDPVGTIRALYARVGMEFDEAVQVPALRAAFSSNKHFMHDSYKEYHGFPLRADSVEKILAVQEELNRLVEPIVVG